MSAQATIWSVREDRESEHHGWFVVDVRDRGICWVRDEANARLFAAAPELFRIVEGFQRKLETYASVFPDDKELRRLLAECDAALAKARGQ